MKHLIAFFVMLLSWDAFADLTVPQMQTLKAAALADPTAATYVTNPSPANDLLLANWYNQAGSKIVWRSVLMPEVMRSAIIDGAAQLDNLTVGKRDALLYLVSGDLPNSPSLRTALDGLCGTQNNLKANIQSAERRTGTVSESTLAVGTGTEASPADMTFEGMISQGDASQIRSQ